MAGAIITQAWAWGDETGAASIPTPTSAQPLTHCATPCKSLPLSELLSLSWGNLCIVLEQLESLLSPL